MTAYSSVLYGGKLCIIWDGTYYYIEKSSNYNFRRHTYSGQKHRPLLKFISLVFPDGYVLDSIGPYLADRKNNDAGITQHILSLHGDLTDWLSEGDVCVVDRGFRDVLDVFENLGLETKMPSHLKKGLSQHTTEEANQSRLVTKVRWAVEAYHGRMKKKASPSQELQCNERSGSLKTLSFSDKNTHIHPHQPTYSLPMVNDGVSNRIK